MNYIVHSYYPISNKTEKKVRHKVGKVINEKQEKKAHLVAVGAGQARPLRVAHVHHVVVLVLVFLGASVGSGQPPVLARRQLCSPRTHYPHIGKHCTPHAARTRRRLSPTRAKQHKAPRVCSTHAHTRSLRSQSRLVLARRSCGRWSIGRERERGRLVGAQEAETEAEEVADGLSRADKTRRDGDLIA